MDQGSLNSNLIIVSPQHSYSYKLIQYLFKYFNNDEVIIEQTEELQQMIETKLLIDTKYYTCEITLHSFQYNYFNQDNSIEKLSKLKIDGIFFIVDANTMNGLDCFINFCDQILNETQPGLQAIIYDRKEGTKINYEMLENEEKKLEAFVEQIYLDLNIQPLKQQAKQLSEQEDESLGYPRVVEVLECNTWTYMRPKSQDQKEKQQKVKLPEKQKTPQEQIEYEDEQFAQLIHDMTKIRTSKMTDDERREKASNLMSQLMNLVQEDDDDDL